MLSRSKLGVLAFALVIICAALMQHDALRIAGIAPNLILVTLIVFSSFTENPLFYAVLVLVGTVFGRATPVVFDSLAVATAVLCFAVFWLQRRMVWPGLVGTGISVTIATVLTYAFLAPRFLWQHPGIWLLELAYNVMLSLVLFEVLRFFFGSKIRNH